MDTVMQRDNERRRVVLDGRRTDDGTWCAPGIEEHNSGWASYPRCDAKLGAGIFGIDTVGLATKDR